MAGTGGASGSSIMAAGASGTSGAGGNGGAGGTALMAEGDGGGARGFSFFLSWAKATVPANRNAHMKSGFLNDLMINFFFGMHLA